MKLGSCIARLAAIAQIRPLAWEPPHAEGVALKKTKKKEKRKKRKIGLAIQRFGVSIQI